MKDLSGATAIAVDDGAFPPPARDADPAAHAAAIVAASGTSFAAGMRILPPLRRRGMHAIYAFCRSVDDIADGDLPTGRKRAMLETWRGEVASVYAGRPRSLIGAALLDPIDRFDLPRAEFEAMLDGMAMDVDGPVVAPGYDRLATYVRRVAGSVGLLSMRVFGAWIGAPSERFGLALAEAMQLVNILRDVEEDAAIGRLYLPAEALARAGVPPAPEAAARHAGLPRVCAEVGARARFCFEAARREIPLHRRANLASALMMMGPYEGYLSLMERRGWRRDRPVRLGRLRKLGLAARCVAFPLLRG